MTADQVLGSMLRDGWMKYFDDERSISNKNCFRDLFVVFLLNFFAGDYKRSNLYGT